MPNKTPHERAQELRGEALLWEMVAEAFEQQKSPVRERVVVMHLRDEYVATHRYEINQDNGYCTVQLKDGSIMPIRLGRWCLSEDTAQSYFNIARSQIVVDDPLDS